MIPLYTDENVDRRIVDGLRQRGLDLQTAHDAKLTGPIPDERHLEHATAAGRALLTADRDLLVIARAWSAEGKAHAGVIFYRIRAASVGHVVREVDALARRLAPEDARNRVSYVSRERVG